MRNAKKEKKIVRKILITSIIQNYDNYCKKKRKVSNKFVDGKKRESISKRTSTIDMRAKRPANK